MQQFQAATRFSSGQKKAFVDIDDTICFYAGSRSYDRARPSHKNIAKINRLYNQGWHITYWTARGASSGIDYRAFTTKQLQEWGCNFHDLMIGKEKGSFDLVIDDKAVNIEDLKPQTTGFACSCFDLLHTGHALMLQDCKSVCDYLIIGLQTDPTLDRQEKNKPIQTLEERRVMIESVKYVDEVVIYDTEASLRKLLKTLTIDIRIMGSDWKNKNFTGDDLKIPIHWHSRTHDYSSSALRRKIFLEESKRNV